MATPEEIRIQQEGIQNSEKLLDLSSQLNNSITERRRLLKNLTAEEQLYFATVKQQQKLSQDIAANAEKYLGYQIKSKDLAKQIKAVEDNTAKSKIAFKNIQNDVTKQYQDALKANSKLIEQIDKENKLNLKANNTVDATRTIFQDLLKRRERGESISLRELAIARRRFRDAQEEVKTSDQLLKNLTENQQKQENLAKTAAEIIKNGKETLKAQEEEIKFLKENERIRKRIEKSTGLLGAFSKSLSKLPGIGQYLNADEAITEMEKLAAEIEEAGDKATSFSNRLKIGLKGLSTLAKGFYENIKSPEAVFTFIVTKALEANKQVVELGKSLNLSASAAEDLRQGYADFARSTGDTFINTDRLLKAQTELSQQLGIAVRFSNEELATFAKLTELTGLSSQEAGNLAKASAAAGMPTEKYTDSLREAAFYAQQSTKTHFSSKEILQDVSKLSAGILVKFQGNPKALGQAVVEARKLGLTLDQIDKVGESLLNFEQSLENELKAELITGKQLNLERARAAALSGDQLALTKEISSQVGTLEDFQNMNVIAQKSLADAFGLSREEMSEMLMKQEAINKYGDEAAKLNKEQLEDMKRQGLSASEYLKKQEQQRAAQDKFQDAMIKLQDIIGNLVAGPVGQLLDALADIVGTAVNILSIFSPLFSVISGIAELISDIASSTTGKWVIGLIATAVLLPKIASGFGGIYTSLTSIVKSIPSLGKSLKSAFSVDGVKKYFSSIKEGFAGTKSLTGGVTDKAKETITSSRGITLTKKVTDKVKETATDKAGDLADKVTGKADEVTSKTKGEGVGGFLKGIKMNDVLKGAAAILILSGALFIAAKAFQEFAEVEWESIAKGGVALVGLAGVAFLLGKMTGPILKGAIAIGILGAALIPLGYALKLAAPGIEAFGNAIKSAFEGIGTIITAAATGIATIFSSLQGVDVTKLLAIGPALIGIGVGLASLGAGGVIGAIGAFLGGDPIEKLQGLAAAGDGLTKTATALQSIAGALIGVSAALATIDTSKLEALDEFSNNQSSNSVVSGITGLITAPIKAIGDVINGGKEEINTGIDLTPMIAAINEVKASIDKLYSKDTSINMDGKKVGSTLVQGSYKVA